MKKLTALLLVLILTLPFATAAAFAVDAVPTQAEIQAGVSFRDRPNTTSNVMRYLKTGETATVLSVVNPNWYLVRDERGVSGYVSSSSKYITIVSNARVIYGVNFRTAPSTSGEIIRMLSKGENLLVLEKAGDSWYKIVDKNGMTGYISSDVKYTVTDFSVTRIALPLQERIESFIEEAAKYMGTPYVFGSTRFDTASFDCSDLVQQAFWDATREAIPGDSRAQGDYVRSLGPVSTDWRSLQRGDLMFFMSYEGAAASNYAGIDKSAQTITHVAIYLGDGTVLHTYSPESGGVRIDSIAGRHWEYRFLFGGAVTK